MINKFNKMEIHIINSLKEDDYKKDITTKLIPKDTKAKAIIKAKESFYIYGIEWMKKVFKIVDKNLIIKKIVNDGDYIKKNQILASIEGNNHNILIAERTALNYLQSMSGVYDKCKKYQGKISRKKIKILHTRKTLPSTRLPYREACIAAGCMPHRKSLSDSILLKENHLKFIDDFQDVIKKAQKTQKKIIVEANTSNFAKKIIKFKIDRILLDNFTPKNIKEIMRYMKNCKVEISGSINLLNINKFAVDGVNFISIGDLTKNVTSKDISLSIV